ncbi:MAG: glycosyltransferase [bacterium]
MKVVILHASAGAGHRRAAEALSAAFTRVAPDVEPVVCDLLDYTPALFRRTYARGYLNLVRRVPELWGYMYALSDRSARVPWRRKVRSIFNHLNTQTFSKFYASVRPDVAICTHFMPLELLATRVRLKKIATPLYGVVTDFAVHALWMQESVNGYFVATDEARRHLVRLGVAPQMVRVTGIPVDPVFADPLTSAAARKRLGLDPARPVVLLLSGGFGVGPTVNLLTALRDLDARVQVLSVVGNNESMRLKAERVAASLLGNRARVYGFVDNMHELMAAADLVVSKPGGLTSSEVLARGKPMVIVDPIPGQEQRNSEFMLEEGAAIRLHEVGDAAAQIGALLSDTRRLARLTEAAAHLGRPQAAETVARGVLADLAGGMV